MFTPLQRNMTALGATNLKARFPEYAWSNLERPAELLLGANIDWPLGLARFRTSMEIPNVFDRSLDLVLEKV